MKELEMIKAFAELECLDFIVDKFITEQGDCVFVEIESGGFTVTDIIRDGNHYSEYNPLLPNALNCAARDKYEIEVDYSTFNVTCLLDKWLDITVVSVGNKGKQDDKLDLPKAVIECILKSQGLWK